MFFRNVNSTIGWIIKVWFFAGLFLLPLVFWPWTSVPYEIPKVWFFCRWVEGLGLLGVLGMLGDKKGEEGQKGKEGKNINSILVYFVFIFVLIAVVSSVSGVDLQKSVYGNYYRADGLVTLFHLAGLFFFLILFWEEGWKKLFSAAVVAGSLIVSIWAILSGMSGRFGPTFGNPNFLAGYLLVSLPFTAYALKKLGVLGVLGILGQTAAIILTQSRAGILGVLILGAGYWWGRLGKYKLLGILGMLGILGVLGTIVLTKELRVSEGMYFFPESRSRIVVRGLITFAKRPILGWGVANFDYAFQSVDWPMKYEKDVYVDKAHSNLLEVLVTTGVLGFLSYLGIILGILGRLEILGKEKNDWNKTLLAVFLLFLFHSQTNVISINEEIFFWLMAGIVAGAG